MIKSVPIEIKKLLYDIYLWLGKENFIIYGGTPIDLLLKKKVNDYDIAIKSESNVKIKKIKRSLKSNGFKIIGLQREYIIQKNKKVILVYAKKKKIFLDLAFIENEKMIGIFDIESMIIRYPSSKIIDKNGAMTNLKNKRLNLIKPPSIEDPYIILGRLIYLCSKYNISLQYPKHKSLILNIKKKCEQDYSKRKYFYKQILPSFYAHIFKALIKSEDRITFCKVLINYEIFKNIFPSLERALIIVSTNEKLKRKFISIKNRKTLIKFLILNLNGYLKRDFLKEINRLKIRKWE